MTRRLLPIALLALVAGLISSNSASARLRVFYEDAEVVTRSDLIVLAVIKPESIRVTGQRHADSIGPTTTYATLTIQHGLKGQFQENEIPIAIHDGLVFLLDGKINRDTVVVDVTRELPKGLEKGSIQIVDTAHDDATLLINDARKPTLWLLRKDKDGSFSITDPEDVQPGSLQSYYEAQLAADPEAAVRIFLQTHPEVAVRATRFLEQCHLNRIFREPDAHLRVEQLLPYLRVENEFTWQVVEEIQKAGDVAGPYLVAMFDDRRNVRLRTEIANIWGKIHYKPAADLLIKALADQDQFWATQTVTKNWWSDMSQGEDTMRYRQESYGFLQAAIGALGSLADPSAREALESTRKRWHNSPAGDAIEKDCEDALSHLH